MTGRPRAWMRALPLVPALLALGSCAHGAFEERLQAGDTEAALAAFRSSEDLGARPDAMLYAAVLLLERGRADDAPEAREILRRLIELHPARGEARAARLVLALEAERDSLRSTRTDLALDLAEAERARDEMEAKVRHLEQEVALQESFLSMLSRMASRLESQLQSEREELQELRTILQRLMQVDLDRPPVIPPGPPPGG